MGAYIVEWLNKDGPIMAYSFNADFSMVAAACGTNEVFIYKINGKEPWKLVKTLADHDQIVTDVDWAPRTNRIVTCSQDRNTYVYTPKGANDWEPSLVILRSPKSGTCVRWSPKEDKFAVGTGANLVAICYHEEENNWWISKHLKKPFGSTIKSVNWHPNNVLLSVGCCDNTARVVSAYIKDVDEKPAPSVWGTKLPFNILCAEYHAGGWVHSLSFSPDGNALAFVSHNSTLTVAYPQVRKDDAEVVSGVEDSATVTIYRLALSDLPYKSLIWISDNRIVAAGHNCQPVLFEGSDQGWRKVRSIDDQMQQKLINKDVKIVRNTNESDDEDDVTFTSVRATFRNMDLKNSVKVSKLFTVHQNTISQVCRYGSRSTGVKQISTAGVDGFVVVWSI